MVTRTYICKKCKKEFDVESSIKDSPLSKCPDCKEPVLQKYHKDPIDNLLVFNNPHCGAKSKRFL